MEKKCDEGTGGGGNGIQDSRRTFNSVEEIIWQRRGRSGKGGGTEEVGARRENNGRICPGI